MWAGWPCQRSVRSPPSPRGDGSGVPVGRVAVPKTGQKPLSPRRDATEVPVEGVAVPKTGQKNALARRDATEAAVDRVAVSKTGQKPPSPRRDATGVLVGRVAVPKTGQKNSLPRRVGSGALVGRVPVPKTGQKNSLPRRDGSGVLVGRVAVPKQIVRRIIMVEVKVLVGYAPWQMVSGGIGSRKEGAHGVGRPSGTICHGAIMDRLFLRRRHRLPKRGARQRQVVEDHAGNVGRVRSEAKLNGVLRNP
ncbi:MAG: hypothetical protein PUD74_05690 [Bacteroidales bacterium]|nr:hypothetical protein [Bacteroidales bacterium]